MLLKKPKDIIDNLNILQQAELVRHRAIDLQSNYENLSDKQAFKIATDELFGGSLWNN